MEPVTAGLIALVLALVLHGGEKKQPAEKIETTKAEQPHVP